MTECTTENEVKQTLVEQLEASLSRLRMSYTSDDNTASSMSHAVRICVFFKMLDPNNVSTKPRTPCTVRDQKRKGST